MQAFERTGENPTVFLDRHFSGDFGDVKDEGDLQLNKEGMTTQGQVMSEYKLSNGTRIWIITDPGHAVTTVLLPSEY